MIKLDGIHKAFGNNHVLRGVDLEIAKGSSMVIIGGSGTGKSVALKCVLGLISPDRGTIHVDGEDVTRVDRDAFLAALSPASRVILLNTPHNPTGKVFTRDELEWIAAVAVEHDLVVVSDDVYQHMVFDGEHIPIAAFPGMRERTISIGSAGKSFSFTGWKVGWVTTSPELRAAVMTAKQFLTFVNAAPLQPAVAAGLRLGDDYFSQLRNDLLAKRNRLHGGLEAAGFDVLHTQGTYFLTCDIRGIAKRTGLPNTSIEFCLALPEACGVVAVPSEVFYTTREAGRHLVRFAFCKKDEVLDEAISRLATLTV